MNMRLATVVLPLFLEFSTGAIASTEATQVITDKSITTSFKDMSLDGIRHPMSWSETAESSNASTGECPARLLAPCLFTTSQDVLISIRASFRISSGVSPKKEPAIHHLPSNEREMRRGRD